MGKTFEQADAETGINLGRFTEILLCETAITQEEAETLSRCIKTGMAATDDEIRGTAAMFRRMQADYYFRDVSREPPRPQQPESRPPGLDL